MPKLPIDEGRVHAWLTELFEDDLHARRVLAMTHVTLGVIHAASLGIHAIGRGLADARGTLSKHAVKQVDRFLSNEGISVSQLAAQWVPYVLGERSEALVSLDWTEFAKDGQTTLVASLITTHGRATPLLWHTADKTELKGSRSAIEDALLARLREVIPPDVRVTVLADRGFADRKLFEHLASSGFGYVVRLPEKTQVRDREGKAQRAGFWVPASGRTLMLKSATVTEHEQPVAAFVCVKKARMKEPWCLVTSEAALTGAQVVNLYARRFTIEESFRDVKDIKFGLGLSATHIKSPARRDRLLLVSALAMALLTLLGAAGEAIGIDKYWKVNTSKKRQHSLFRQGCNYYSALPNMRPQFAEPLMSKFGELVRGQAVFREALGLI